MYFTSVYNYFDKNFNKSFKNSDDVQKLELIAKYEPPLIVIDFIAGIYNRNDIMSLKYHYYGVFNVFECKNHIIALLSNRKIYKIVFVYNKCFETEYCFCSKCFKYKENTIII
ncbi:hypothetical protein EDEG_03816 [Edhazardia aedis USNM 41457]|uniref:Uncharacterized protein n=1 Tax=Edhazardia aedis (strain USNM 41457) TaxID=1003232 RepID=J9D1D3_EDHAE|nr:hypothetical protein EDEG_03816 [Edhazardia aedis USNM 41457]|eukprot:EJW01641.1 hypothetical protein EDEG_03816 [Edhazardia aedis USNM 41457]